MKLYLARTVDVADEVVSEVARIISSPTPPYEIERVVETVCLGDDVLDLDSFFEALKQTRQQLAFESESFLVLLTCRANTENWFSACSPGDVRNIYVHAADWEYFVPCHPAYAIAYEIIENILETLMFNSLEGAVGRAHDPPMGCINDMCSWKPDIMLKLRTADICPECLMLCEEQAIDPAVMDHALAVMESVRMQSLYSVRNRRGDPEVDAWPFSVAFTRRKLQMATDSLPKFLLLLDHFDSLVRTAVLLCGRVLLGADFVAFAQRQELAQRPSLGHWVAALRALADLHPGVATSGWDLTLPAELQRRLAAVVDKATEEELVSLRNERRGHGYLNPHDESYQMDFMSHLPAVRDVEQILSPLFGMFTMVYLISDNLFEPDKARATVWKLMGDHPDFVQETIEYSPSQQEIRPIINQVYAIDRTMGKWHALHDSIVYDMCPVCEHRRILLAEGERYLDPYAGHRINLPIN
jgi:hypothetical protein